MFNSFNTYRTEDNTRTALFTPIKMESQPPNQELWSMTHTPFKPDTHIMHTCEFSSNQTQDQQRMQIRAVFEKPTATVL